MLSSSPAVPLSSINFAGGGRRLSLVTHEGRELFTAHDGLPSPEHLTPITGNTPTDSEAGSAPLSRRGSDMHLDGQQHAASRDGAVHSDGASLKKVPSRGGIWHDDPDWVHPGVWDTTS
ncbi:hypothetical protein IAT38_008194 [Cryptococcus sp. DSM 104549]